jgi:hypothetical protein
MTLPQILTMNEAAKALRIGRTNLQRLIQRHPFYFANGARKLFTEDHIRSLIAAMERDTTKVRLREPSGRRGETPWDDVQQMVANLLGGGRHLEAPSEQVSRRVAEARNAQSKRPD